MSSFRLSRRACLKGLGVSMALPALEIMTPTRAHAQAAAALRFLCVYSPNGFLMDKWTPTATGTTWTTPPLLKALEPFRSDFSILSGLGNYTASIATMFGGSHTRATGSLLTQCPISFTTGSNVKNGISVDQIIANTLKDKTKFPSLPVGGRAGSLSGDCEDGYSCAYNNNISWAGPTTPVPKQVNPLDVFNRLFPGGAPMPMPPGMPAPVDKTPIFQKGILDAVSARADSLKKRLGKTDRLKLDEYFTSVRDVEQRLARNIMMPGMPGMPGMAGACTVGAPPKDNRDNTLPFPEHLDLLSDMIALAFQCDVTRVATYMYEHSFSDVRSFSSFLPGVTGRHHQITHSNQAAQEEKINLFYIDRFAYLMGKLKNIKEGDKSILDNSVVYFTSEFGDGHGHNHRKLAMLVAGKGGGKLKTGLHVNYPLDPGAGTGPDGLGNPRDTQLGHLHLTTLQVFGINQPTFGQDDKGMPIANKPLSEILV